MLKSRKTLLLILILGFIFFARNAHLQLATDDIGWLKGEAPTVFDQYRLIPRFIFVSLYALLGPSPVAALAMIFCFHALNTILVYELAGKLLGSPAASNAAAFVFAVNPLTLSTITWISCFSYILGSTLALLSLSSFWKGRNSSRYWLWWAGAVFFYGMGLFCSHEIFLLPALFPMLGWRFGKAWLKRGLVLFAIAMSLGLLVNFFFYDFGRYGVETAQLFSLRFVSAFASSALAFGLSLGLAYPLSFFVHPTAFLQFTFAEPVRWGITLGLLSSGIVLYKPNPNWRTWLVLMFSCAALITPYIIRFGLMPPGVNYDISYVLSGRVFYLPFIVIALMWSKLWVDFYEKYLKGYPWGRFLALLPLGAYLYALLFLYSPGDFMGLAVILVGSQIFPPPWNPYQGDHPIWLASLALIGGVAVVRRAIGGRWRG